MANVEVDLIIEALAKGFDRLEKDLKAVGDAGEKSEKGIEKAGKQTGFLDSQMKKLITGGVLLAAGKALLDFGQASITAASDVEEMQSKFNTVFRDLAGPVTQELETFAEAANRSKFDLMGFAATLQDTFVPLGFARDEAASMSVQLVKLAEDLASFNNLNTEDVVRDLQSALVGNTETLRKYGVVAQETQIKQEALSTGLWDGTGAIDAQSKAQAILQLTLKGTTDAQGDAIKTADSYANTSKGTEAALTDLKVAIGEGLIPVMGDLQKSTAETARELTGLIQIKNILSQAVDAGIITQEQFVNMQLEAALSSETLAEKSEEVIAVMEELSAKTEAATKNQRKATLITSELAAADAVLLMHVNDLNEAEAERIQGIIDYSAEAAEAAGVSEDLADKQAQLANQTGSTEQAILAANLAMERQIELENQAAEAAALLQEKQAEYYQTAIEGNLVQDNLNQSIYDSAEASGASAEQLAILGGALGLYSEEAVEAALKSAAIQIKIDELAQAYVDGKISVDDMRAGIQDFIASLDNVPDTVTTEVKVTGVDAAISKVGSLQAQLNALGGQVSAAEAAGATQRDTGDVGLAHGADFVVPPGFPNDSFGPLWVQSGERVQVTPAGQSGMGGSSQRVTLYNPQFYGVSDSQDMLKQLQDLST